MQEQEKILSIAVANILKSIRLKTGKSLNLFCNEYEISTSTLNDLENAKRSVKLFSLYKTNLFNQSLSYETETLLSERG